MKLHDAYGFYEFLYTDWLFGFLAGWLAGWLLGCLAAWLLGCFGLKYLILIAKPVGKASTQSRFLIKFKFKVDAFLSPYYLRCRVVSVEAI